MLKEHNTMKNKIIIFALSIHLSNSILATEEREIKIKQYKAQAEQCKAKTKQYKALTEECKAKTKEYKAETEECKALTKQHKAVTQHLSNFLPFWKGFVIILQMFILYKLVHEGIKFYYITKKLKSQNKQQILHSTNSNT
jgi:hypothetical protein